ncbi:MAG: pantoate--beta-alanine ligase, partial [Firmicutes bacterium]|nr:pantoate--beta-alanine ligase [Bacillota bacterium]
NLNIILHRMPIIREADGLAKSSRNVYLTPEERAQAPVLFAAVRKAEQIYCAGERDAAAILEVMSAELAKANLAKIDYLQIVDTENLLPVKHLDREVLVAMAVYFGSTRLIDNTILG